MANSDGAAFGELDPEPNPSSSTNSTDSEFEVVQNIEQDFDPWCDPKNPIEIVFDDIHNASCILKDKVIRTSCNHSLLSSLYGCDIFFKNEYQQVSGSYKERGGCYALYMLSEEDRKKGVIAASAGNHAAGISYHGSKLQIPVIVVMPAHAPIKKINICRSFGAKVILKGKDLGEAKSCALAMAKQRGMCFINGYDHPHIIAGQGTIAMEILEDVPEFDYILIPIGGGGLVTGISIALKTLAPNVKVIGVESEAAPSYAAALKMKEPVAIKLLPSIAEGLAVPKVGYNAFFNSHKLLYKVITVKEHHIALAILRLSEVEKAVVEGAGATGFAALLSGLLPELHNKRVVIPLCGGNIDNKLLSRCIERGMAIDGRLVKFSLILSDETRTLTKLTEILSELNISIRDLTYDKPWILDDVFFPEVKLICETSGRPHTLKLQEVLTAQFENISFNMIP